MTNRQTPPKRTGIVIDVNVWLDALDHLDNVAQGLSSARSQINAHDVLRAIYRDERFVVHLSEHIRSGVERKLLDHGVPPDRARIRAAQIQKGVRLGGGQFVQDPPEVSNLPVEWEDRRVHDTAIATESAILITNDGEFAKCRQEALSSPGGVLIQRPREFSRMLRNIRPIGGGAPVEHDLDAAPRLDLGKSPTAGTAGPYRTRPLVRGGAPRPHRRPPPRGRER